MSHMAIEAEPELAEDGGSVPPLPPAPATTDPEDGDDEPIDIQIGGQVTDEGVYTAFARIPGVDDLHPKAQVQLTFDENLVGGEAVVALFNLFIQNVDDLIRRIDQARIEGQRPVVSDSDSDSAVETMISEGGPRG